MGWEKKTKHVEVYRVLKKTFFFCIALFEASRRGKKELKSSRDKNARHEPLWVGGEKSLLCDPGSELRQGGRENRRAKVKNGMEPQYGFEVMGTSGVREWQTFIVVATGCSQESYAV